MEGDREHCLAAEVSVTGDLQGTGLEAAGAAEGGSEKLLLACESARSRSCHIPGRGVCCAGYDARC